MTTHHIINPHPHPHSHRPTKYAVLIGINYYGTPNQLGGCINDIEDVRGWLIKHGYTSIVTLKDSDDHVINGAVPTRENIISVLRSAVHQLHSGDTLYVHYSGHGSQLPCTTEDDGFDECICPVDFNFNAPDCGFIRDDTLKQILVDALPDGARLRAVFDSCHSGSILDLPHRWIIGNDWIRDNSAKCTKNVVVISGCKDYQTSADSVFNGHGNGALTWAFLQVINNVDSANSWRDLGDQMREKLKTGGYDQIPQISFVSKSHINDVIMM